jgi:hypothetical protein
VRFNYALSILKPYFIHGVASLYPPSNPTGYGRMQTGSLLHPIKEPDKRRILPVFSLSSPYIVAIGAC